MVTKENTLLVERYRPTRLKNFVGNSLLKKSIQNQLNNNDIQNMLLFGNPGVGKTTLAKLIINNLDCDSLYINASDERGIETIRDKVIGFASQASLKPIKVVILDEADFLTIQAQASLRNVIETFSRSTRFILTCNYIERMIDPIQSRCTVMKLEHNNEVDMVKHLMMICNRENITASLDNLEEIVNFHFPDLRKMINTIQSNTIDGELHLDRKLSVSGVYMKDVVDELKKSKPYFNTIRQIIANSGSNDYEELYRFLYDNAKEYLPGKEGTVAILINEHLYQRNFKVDQEICVMSLISNLIDNK